MNTPVTIITPLCVKNPVMGVWLRRARKCPVLLFVLQRLDLAV